MISADIDGKTVAPSTWNVSNGTITAQINGIELTCAITGDHALTATMTNNTRARVHIGAFHFNAVAGQGSDLLSIPGRRIRIHKEGLTMATPAASLRFGEKDFELNPEYKPFAVLDPAEYHDDIPNKFSGEYAAIISDSETGISALMGFISSERQFTRIAVELEENGISRLEAISCCDNIAVDHGESVCSEALAIFASDDAYGLLEQFASAWGRIMHARTWDHTPTGWCSWYYYFEKITEADMLENIHWLRDNRTAFPLEYIQLDDGYQSALGDWLTCNEKFPHGLASLAAETKAAGFKPGVWLAPFMVEERSHLYREHPEWMVKDGSGQTAWAMNWRGSRVALLDCTIPAACDRLTAIFAQLRSWGFEYTKLDFLVQEIGVISLGGHYADPKATRAQALRRGLGAIRRGFGDDKFIVGCTCPFGPEVGLVNGARIGTDITPYWEKGEKIYKEAPTVANVCRNVINRRYLHGRLWLNDPDTHIARIDNNELTEDEVNLWTAAVWLTGGALLLSDRFSTLTPERAALSKMLLADPDAFTETRPLDFLEREFPAVWFAKNTKLKNTYAVGVFNFETTIREYRVNLPVTGTFNATEHWSGLHLSGISGSFNVSVAPHTCRIFLLRPV